MVARQYATTSWLQAKRARRPRRRPLPAGWEEVVAWGQRELQGLKDEAFRKEIERIKTLRAIAKQRRGRLRKDLDAFDKHLRERKRRDPAVTLDRVALDFLRSKDPTAWDQVDEDEQDRRVTNFLARRRKQK